MSDSAILTYTEIDREAWSRLVQTSRTGTWFQSPEAYELFASLPEMFTPFAFGVVSKPESDSGQIIEATLRGVCVGYVTKEKSRLRQFFTRRAIILGGPCLAEDATDEEVTALLSALHAQLSTLNSPHSTLNAPIYIEIRNFNDYSRWRGAFEAAGFAYQLHLNFHVDCTDKQMMWERLSDNRKRQIKRGKPTPDPYLGQSDAPRCSSRSNCQAEAILHLKGGEKEGKDVSEQDVREWYGILQELYRTKVKTPLLPVEFFVQAYKQGVGQFLLIRHEGKIIGGSMVVKKPTPGPYLGQSDASRCSSRSNCQAEAILHLKGGENTMKNIGENGVVYEWYECGMNAAYKEQYPSVMATWAGMQYAHEQGCARYDMMGAGVPGVPYGVRDFKSEFGGTLVEHGRWLYVAKPWLYAIGKAGVEMLKGES